MSANEQDRSRLVPCTIFTTDECQALTDLIHRLLNERLEHASLRSTVEEMIKAMSKLKKAVILYAPVSKFSLRTVGDSE